MQNDNIQGYLITDTIKVSDTLSIVVGHNPNAPSPYVVWECKNDHSYCMGKYMNDPIRAKRELCNRAMAALRFQKRIVDQQR